MKESYLRQIGQVSMISLFFFREKLTRPYLNHTHIPQLDHLCQKPGSARFKILLERRKLSFYPNGFLYFEIKLPEITTIL